jgi:protein-disulfide isomerase
MAQDAHPAACEAAAAVRMARDRGKADATIDFVFANQTTLTPAAVKAHAANVLGVTDWDKEYAAKLPEIQRDVADGVALKVGRTPTYFVNGVRSENEIGWLPAYYFELAIQLELKKAAPPER